MRVFLCEEGGQWICEEKIPGGGNIGKCKVCERAWCDHKGMGNMEFFTEY